MGDFGCGDGGWTPIMKINGNKVTISPRRKLEEKIDGRKIYAESLVTIEHRSSLFFGPETKRRFNWRYRSALQAKKGRGKVGCGFRNNRQKSSLLDEPPRVPHAYLMTLSLKQAIIDAMFKFEKSFVNNFSIPSITLPISGRTEGPIKMLLARMALTYRKQSYQPTGKHPSPRSASVWRLDDDSRSGSS